MARISFFRSFFSSPKKLSSHAKYFTNRIDCKISCVSPIRLSVTELIFFLRPASVFTHHARIGIEMKNNPRPASAEGPMLMIN